MVTWFSVTLTQFPPPCLPQEKCERRSKSSQHSRSGSSGSPVGSSREPQEGGRGGRHRRDSAVDSGPEDSTLSKSLPDAKPCLKKLLEKPSSSSVLDLHSGRTSLRPTQYRLEEALPLPCSAPPLRRFSHSLIRPPLLQSSSSASREGLSSPAPPERQVSSVNETLALRFNSSRHREASHSVRCSPCSYHVVIYS